MNSIIPATVAETITERQALIAALRAQKVRINERLAVGWPSNIDEDGYPVLSTVQTREQWMEGRRNDARANGYSGPLTRAEVAALAAANSEVG
jgi:hypothetical protein